MKKVIRLTESDLARIVRRVIKEESEVTPEMIIDMLMKEAESTPQEDYDDVYDWMQDVFSPVEDKLEANRLYILGRYLGYGVSLSFQNEFY